MNKVRGFFGVRVLMLLQVERITGAAAARLIS